ncbi:MAG TPA: hypothetical protein EYP65_08170 [Armatimonadetes bacterium]|nr:hypothetical protein [Armatimonadota bacterium]
MDKGADLLDGLEGALEALLSALRGGDWGGLEVRAAELVREAVKLEEALRLGGEVLGAEGMERVRRLRAKVKGLLELAEAVTEALNVGER